MTLLEEIGEAKTNPSIDAEKSFMSETKYNGVTDSDALMHSMRENSFIGAGMNLHDEYIDTPDEVFKEDEDYKNEDGIEYIKQNYPMMRGDYSVKLLEDVRSIDELEYKAKEAMEQSRIKDYIEDSGFKGFAIDAVSSLVDVPLIIGVTMISPVSGLQLVNTKLRAGIFGGAVELGFQNLQDNIGDRDRSMSEMALSSLFTGALTGLLTKGVDKENITANLVKYQGEKIMGITDEVKDNLFKATTKEEKDEIISKAYDQSLFNYENTKDLTPVELFGRFKESLNDDHKSGKISDNLHSKLRSDFEFLTKESPSEAFSMLAHHTFVDGTLQNNNVNVATYVELKDLYIDVGKSQLRKEFVPHERELDRIVPKSMAGKLTPSWISRSGDDVSYIANMISQTRAYGLGSDDFAINKAVSHMKIMGIKEDDALPLARNILESVKKTSTAHGERNIRFGSKHFSKERELEVYDVKTKQKEIIKEASEEGTLIPVDNYHTTIYDYRGIQRLKDRGIDDIDEIKDFFYESFTRPIRAMNEKQLAKTDGTAKIRKILSREEADKALSLLVSKIGSKTVRDIRSTDSNVNIFRDAFEEAGIDTKIIDDYFGALNDKTGAVFLKKRINLDRSYIHKTKSGKSIDITDFTSNDYYATQESYLRKMSGRIATERFNFANKTTVYKDILDDAGEKIGSEAEDVYTKLDLSTDAGVKAYRNIVKEELTAKAEKGEISTTKMADELTRFDYMMNHMHGKPTALNPDSPYHKGLMIARNMNIFRLLGSISLSMVAEMHNVIAYTGAKNMLSSSKYTKDLISYFRDGKTGRADYDEMGEVLGIGNEYVAGVRSSLQDTDFDTDIYGHTKRWVDKALDNGIKVSERFAEFTMMVSGMKPLTAMMQIAMYQGLIKEIPKMASSAKLNMRQKTIFREMGIGKDMIDRISNQMSKYTSNKKGKEVLNFKDWDDDNAKEIMTIGMRRLIDNVIQKPSLGKEMGISVGQEIFSSSPLGKMIMELKQYMYGSYIAQFGKLYNSKNAFHYLNNIAQMGTLSMLYIAEQHALHSNNQEKLRENLETKNLITNGIIGRMSITGFPNMVAGAGSRATMGENVFSSYGNAQGGMASASINSLATVGLANSLGNVIPNVIEYATDGDKDSGGIYKTGKQLLPKYVFLKPFITRYVDPIYRDEAVEILK